MMGYMSAFGSLGRIFGPLLLAKLYSEEGPRLTFLVSIFIVLLGILITLAFYKRLVPYSVFEERSKSNESSSPPSSPGDQPSDHDDKNIL